MKIWPVALCAVALYATQLHARLDDTIDECIARYGNPVHTSKEQSQLHFEKDGITFFCHFLDEKCDSMVICRFSKGFSDAEIDAFLVSNGGGWILNRHRTVANYPRKTWSNDSGGGAACTGNMFIIFKRVSFVPCAIPAHR